MNSNETSPRVSVALPSNEELQQMREQSAIIIEETRQLRENETTTPDIPVEALTNFVNEDAQMETPQAHKPISNRMKFAETLSNIDLISLISSSKSNASLIHYSDIVYSRLSAMPRNEATLFLHELLKSLTSCPRTLLFMKSLAELPREENIMTSILNTSNKFLPTFVISDIQNLSNEIPARFNNSEIFLGEYNGISDCYSPSKQAGGLFMLFNIPDGIREQLKTLYNANQKYTHILTENFALLPILHCGRINYILVRTVQIKNCGKLSRGDPLGSRTHRMITYKSHANAQDVLIYELENGKDVINSHAIILLSQYNGFGTIDNKLTQIERLSVQIKNENAQLKAQIETLEEQIKQLNDKIASQNIRIHIKASIKSHSNVPIPKCHICYSVLDCTQLLYACSNCVCTLCNTCYDNLIPVNFSNEHSVSRCPLCREDFSINSSFQLQKYIESSSFQCTTCKNTFLGVDMHSCEDDETDIKPPSRKRARANSSVDNSAINIPDDD